MSDAASLSLPRMTAWERWEMGAVGAVGGVGARNAAVRSAATHGASNALDEQAGLAHQRQAAQQAGHAEGYALGFQQGLNKGAEEGFEKGHAEGHAAARIKADAEHAAVKAQWLALAASLPRAWQAAEQEVAHDLLALAFALARQVLGQSLAVEPAGMITAVRELLHAEPAMTGHPKLLLHPDDALLVKEHLADDLHSAGWSVRADPGMERGGCRVMATSGELDASLSTRWAILAGQIGIDQKPCREVAS